MAQRWRWDANKANKELALKLVFEGRLSLDKIALNCAVSPRTLDNWVKHPEFVQRIEELRADMAAALRDVCYADKTRRILALDQMAESARQEYEARPWLEEVRPTKDGSITNEHFNEGAFGAFRGALDDIAKELGQRKDIKAFDGDQPLRLEFINDWQGAK